MLNNQSTAQEIKSCKERKSRRNSFMDATKYHKEETESSSE